jgi:hypothetical protein
MSPISPEKQTEIRHAFRYRVNMTPAELRQWLGKPESRQVGQRTGRGASVGHRSGRRILQIRRKRRRDLTPGDYRHMRKVIGFINRHLAQRPPRPPGELQTTRWRYALMNWGHDPLKRPQRVA